MAPASVEMKTRERVRNSWTSASRVAMSRIGVLPGVARRLPRSSARAPPARACASLVPREQRDLRFVGRDGFRSGARADTSCVTQRLREDDHLAAAVCGRSRGTSAAPAAARGTCCPRQPAFGALDVAFDAGQLGLDLRGARRCAPIVLGSRIVGTGIVLFEIGEQRFRRPRPSRRPPACARACAAAALPPLAGSPRAQRSTMPCGGESRGAATADGRPSNARMPGSEQILA